MPNGNAVVRHVFQSRGGVRSTTVVKCSFRCVFIRLAFATDQTEASSINPPLRSRDKGDGRGGGGEEEKDHSIKGDET